MFGWLRRKNDGFEWREYVRTTIKIRREDRARKIEELKHAAAAGAKEAGRQSLSAGRGGISAVGAGIVRAARWLRAGLMSLARAAGAALMRAIAALGAGLRRGFEHLRSGNLPRLPRNIPTHTKIAAMFGSLGLLSGASAIMQYQKSGFDWSTILAAAVALVLLGLTVAPWLRRAFTNMSSGASSLVMPRIDLKQISLRGAGALAALVLVVGGGLWAWQSGGLSVPSISISSSLPDIAGRGRAVTGDTIRIKGQFVQLAGIESPEITQVCRDQRKRAWRCGQRARAALRRLIRRRKLVCQSVSPTKTGRLQASCSIGNKNVAEQMIRRGYAFATGSVFKSFADAEDAARKAKLGIWKGEVQRPADFRAKRWEIASKSAPDGCPIKGRVVRKSKVYVLPWALDYRQVRVRSRYGGRWFCSEADATNAGFRPSSTG
jgi:endonuclease YncB( thermonuclease family)